MTTPNYAVGAVVQHPMRTEWGRGLVQAVDQNRLLVQWDGRDLPASWMHTNHVVLPLAEDQSPPVFKRRTAAKKNASRPRAKAKATQGNYKSPTHEEVPPPDAA